MSDLDAACVNVDVFQKAWIDVIKTTSGFTDLTPFGHLSSDKINLFKDQIVKRGMIKISSMPQSNLKQQWSKCEVDLSRRHTNMFKRITLAIYMNEYAFCWKQDSALTTLLGK